MRGGTGRRARAISPAADPALRRLHLRPAVKSAWSAAVLRTRRRLRRQRSNALGPSRNSSSVRQGSVPAASRPSTSRTSTSRRFMSNSRFTRTYRSTSTRSGSLLVLLPQADHPLLAAPVPFPLAVQPLPFPALLPRVVRAGVEAVAGPGDDRLAGSLGSKGSVAIAPRVFHTSARPTRCLTSTMSRLPATSARASANSLDTRPNLQRLGRAGGQQAVGGGRERRARPAAAPGSRPGSRGPGRSPRPRSARR